MTVKYRLEVNYYSKDYDDRCCETSSPIYTFEQGLEEYAAEIKRDCKCFDDETIPARVHLWKYNYSGDELDPITIAKNY